MFTSKVIDQNYLREPNPELHEYLRKGNYVVFTDYSSMESYKGDSLTNLKRSLEIVCKYPKQVIITKNNHKVIRLTIGKLKGIRKRITDFDQTRGFGLFCNQIYEMQPGENTSLFRDLEIKNRAANRFFEDNIASAKIVLESIKMIQSTFSAEQIKQMRKSERYSKELIDKIIGYIFTVAVLLMKKNGILVPELRIAKNSYLYRYSIACFLLSIKWIAEGGYESINPGKFQNDMIDMNYVAYGTYFDGVLSKDKKIKEISGITTYILKYVGT